MTHIKITALSQCFREIDEAIRLLKYSNPPASLYWRIHSTHKLITLCHTAISEGYIDSIENIFKEDVGANIDVRAYARLKVLEPIKTQHVSVLKSIALYYPQTDLLANALSTLEDKGTADTQVHTLLRNISYGIRGIMGKPCFHKIIPLVKD